MQTVGCKKKIKKEGNKVTKYFGAFRSPERRWLHSKMFAGGPIKSSGNPQPELQLPGQQQQQKNQRTWQTRLSFNFFPLRKNAFACRLPNFFSSFLFMRFHFCTWNLSIALKRKLHRRISIKLLWVAPFLFAKSNELILVIYLFFVPIFQIPHFDLSARFSALRQQLQ